MLRRIFLFVILTGIAVQAQEEDEVQELLKRNRYDKSVRPAPREGQPTIVKTAVHIRSLSSSDPRSNSVNVRMYLRQEWNDPRLARLSPSAVTVKDNIWVPDTFVENAAGKVEKSDDTSRIRVSPNGDVAHSQLLTFTMLCGGEYEINGLKVWSTAYRRECKIDITSFGSTASDVRYAWKDDGLTISDIHVSGYRVVEKTTRATSATTSSGTYATLSIYINMERTSDRCFFDLPLISMVVLSWLAFWIDRRNVTARLAIGLVALLIAYNLLATKSAQLQRPDYTVFTLAGIFSGVCLCFIFLSLLETTIVHFHTRRNAKLEQEYITKEGKSLLPVTTARKLRRNIPAKLDIISRIAFPVAFLLALIIFGAIFLLTF